eukprot:2719869-Pleurochrysis_carterae.AAC.4
MALAASPVRGTPSMSTVCTDTDTFGDHPLSESDGASRDMAAPTAARTASAVGMPPLVDSTLSRTAVHSAP